jgi:TetR/AcrR family transcriptional regulator, regulator of cefoperazone and chloramphenicol sensitivity
MPARFRGPGLDWAERLFNMVNMGSVADEGDFTAKANIRNAALRLFAERGPDAVTVREIAAAAGVSAALVVHHFGSKDGLRAAVDGYASQAFDGLFAMDEHDLAAAMAGDNWMSVAEMFARSFPHGSPLPAYLRRLLLVNDPAGAALFGRWYAQTRRLLESMTEIGVAGPAEDPAVRAAFLLVNDLALILLRNQIAAAIGVDPLTPKGISRWAKEVTAVYTQGAFLTAPGEEPS